MIEVRLVMLFWYDYEYTDLRNRYGIGYIDWYEFAYEYAKAIILNEEDLVMYVPHYKLSAELVIDNVAGGELDVEYAVIFKRNDDNRLPTKQDIDKAMSEGRFIWFRPEDHINEFRLYKYIKSKVDEKVREIYNMIDNLRKQVYSISPSAFRLMI